MSWAILLPGPLDELVVEVPALEVLAEALVLAAEPVAAVLAAELPDGAALSTVIGVTGATVLPDVELTTGVEAAVVPLPVLLLVLESALELLPSSPISACRRLANSTARPLLLPLLLEASLPAPPEPVLAELAVPGLALLIVVAVLE